MDGSEANAAATRRSHAGHGFAIILRQVKYLSNSIEQAQRGVRRATRPMLAVKSFAAARGTRAGPEHMPRLQSGQPVVEGAVAGLTPAEPFSALVGLSPHQQA
jgi:transposase-like protein